jgi:hypothetical protein
MSTSHCCMGRLRARRAGDVKSRKRGVTRLLGLVTSCTTLILMPKCPACMAAYVMLFTGISISTEAAGVLQAGAGVLCACMILTFVLPRLGWNHRGEVTEEPP